MAKKIIVDTPDQGRIHYTMIESIEDIGEVFCFGPDETLQEDFNNGKTIIVNEMGGYCFLEEDYHTIVEPEIKGKYTGPTFPSWSKEI